MGKAQGGRSRGEAEENDLGGGKEAHRGGSASTVGEGEEGCLTEPRPARDYLESAVCGLAVRTCPAFTSYRRFWSASLV